MLVGAAIAVIVKQPVLVLPLAFLSHFVLDMIPHFGLPGVKLGDTFKHKVSYFEAAFSLIGLVVLVYVFNFQSWLILAAALLAAAPDLEWLGRWFFYERRGRKSPTNAFAHFHSVIQWCQVPWGIAVEIAFFIAGLFALRGVLL